MCALALCPRLPLGLDLDLVASDGREHVRGQPPCSRRAIDVGALGEGQQYMVSLSCFDDPHAIRAVALQAGPLLRYDDVDQSVFDVSEEALEGRPPLVALA